MNNKLRGGVNIGTSSILVAFVLLCLVTFAALTFLSANSDYRLSLEAANRTTEYYNANSQAELLLADIDASLASLLDSCDNEAMYYSSISELFVDNDLINVVDDTPSYISYSIPMNSTQEIHVELRAHYPDSNDSSYFYVEQWNTLNVSPLETE